MTPLTSDRDRAEELERKEEARAGNIVIMLLVAVAVIAVVAGVLLWLGVI